MLLTRILQRKIWRKTPWIEMRTLIKVFAGVHEEWENRFQTCAMISINDDYSPWWTHVAHVGKFMSLFNSVFTSVNINWKEIFSFMKRNSEGSCIFARGNFQIKEKIYVREICEQLPSRWELWKFFFECATQSFQDFSLFIVQRKINSSIIQLFFQLSFHLSAPRQRFLL